MSVKEDLMNDDVLQISVSQRIIMWFYLNSECNFWQYR